MSIEEKFGKIIPHKILFASIEQFFEGFSVRTMNALRNADILLVGDIVRLSKKELSQFDGLGEKSIKEIEDYLDEKNLFLGIKLDWFPRPKKCKAWFYETKSDV